jgi:2-polyprenyl-3-methyl-5-hydroxy-6-metoxy-1,4-benzoquinol methylase
VINERCAPGAEYFNEVRSEVLELVHGVPERVLEVGCGTGALLEELHRRGSKTLCGIEVRPDVAELARARDCVEEVVVGDVESEAIDFEHENFDLVVASHVLEHLVNPWNAVSRLAGWIRPGGQLVGAVPNVRHMKVVLPLLAKGRWRYEESGILDWTHLRFFTRESVISMFAGTGLRLDAIVPTVQGRKSRALERVSFGTLRDLAAYAICFSAFREG